MSLGIFDFVFPLFPPDFLPSLFFFCVLNGVFFFAFPGGRESTPTPFRSARGYFFLMLETVFFCRSLLFYGPSSFFCPKIYGHAGVGGLHPQLRLGSRLITHSSFFPFKLYLVFFLNTPPPPHAGKIFFDQPEGSPQIRSHKPFFPPGLFPNCARELTGATVPRFVPLEGV